MDAPTPPSRRPPILLAALFGAICLVPLGLRAAHPSLFSDDVTRIGQLQTSPSLGAILFVPFNEHMAPLFQAVSWATWAACGRHLPEAPTAFTLASYLPHVLALIALGVLVRRELRSPTTAMAAVAMLGLSRLIGETYAWYSASSFTWALLGAILALDAAGRAATAGGRRRLGWLVASMFASLLAPAGSGIGLLAGPLAAIRLTAAPGASWKARVAGAWPTLGTLGYLAVCGLFRYREVLAASEAKGVGLRAALRNVWCAPADVLLPGQFGLPTLEPYLPDLVALVASSAMLVAGLIWAIRDAEHRAWISGGLWLIAGGYALTIGLRSYPGSPMVLGNERYQLFPQLGVVLMASVAMRPFLRRFDGDPRRSLGAASAVAAVVLLAQIGPIRATARSYRWPEQAKTLAAIERLAEIGRREGITRDQILGAVDPVRTRWFNSDWNALMMLPTAAIAPRKADAEVRSTLLGSLSPQEREALCGGMDVSRHLKAPGDLDAPVTVAQGRLVRAFEVRRGSGPGRWDAGGWASFLEFDLSGAPAEARASARVLAVPVAGPVEVWWSDEDGRWSEGRSVRWWPSRSERVTDWAIPLDRLPHWDGAKAVRVRIAPRRRGAMTAGTPRLLR